MMQRGLNSNQLKLIAMITMTADHIGVILLPQAAWLRLIGRLAFPIYAYMIAEGCQYTKSMPRYLSTVVATAVLCQVVSFLATGSLHQSIMVTFSLSIALIWLTQRALKKGSVTARCFVGIGTAAILFITQGLPVLLSGTDFAVDYGFWGVMLPVVVYLCRSKWVKLSGAAAVLALAALSSPPVQWFALLSLPLLALYNGQRGKLPLKRLFYLYYPAHLAILYIARLFLL